MRSPLEKRGGRAVAMVLSGAVLLGQAAAQDPFQPGLRWRATPDVLQPSIPCSAAFADGGNFVWTASHGPFTRLELFGAFESGPVPAALASLTTANAIGALSVASADDDDALYALVQVPAPDSAHRATLVSRYSAIGAAASGTLTAAWTFDSGLRANGPARLAASADGARVFVANWNGPTPEVRLDVLDPQSGVSLSNVMLFAPALNDMCVAADGTRAAIATGPMVWIVDQNASPLHQEIIPLATSGLAISGDGGLVAIGGTRVRVLQESGAIYLQAFEVLGNANELATRVALSRDGRTLAIGWWNTQNGVDLRFEVVDVLTHVRLFEQIQLGVAGGLQNMPEAVRVTADGRRAALGAWGDGTGASEILLYDRDQNAIVLTADLPGSAFALALDLTGTRLAVGMKDTHANLFAAGGEFRLFDTGEPDTAVLRPPRPGATLEIAAQASGASIVAFLSGPRAPLALPLPGVLGTLALDRALMTVVRRAADQNGRADLSVAIPNDPLLIGTYQHLQSVFLVNGSWTMGETVLDLLVY